MRQGSGFTSCQVLGGCFSSTTMGHMSASRKGLFLHLSCDANGTIVTGFPGPIALLVVGKNCLLPHQVRILGPSRPLACWGKARSNMQHRRHIHHGCRCQAMVAPQKVVASVATYLKHQNLLLAPGFCWHHLRMVRFPPFSHLTIKHF